ncbi:MAG: ATP synthase F1 subunit delta [Oscillospiraceae bacterium]|nr:ATP synthase F1 subunit delta [Oscillospiraceae bacterium]
MERLSLLYASAVFELALEQNKVDECLEQAAALRDSLSDAECLRVLVHPHIPAHEKHELFKKAFAGRIQDSLLGLLFLATDKNRETYLLSALSELIDLIKRHKKIVTAEVSSAVPIDDAQAEALGNMLSKKLNKSVELSLKVDSALIGGPYIFVDGHYIDWTVKKRLRDLTVYMKEGCSA